MKFAILGAGSVGAALTELMCKDENVTAINLIDNNGTKLADATGHLHSKKLRTHKININHVDDLSVVINGSDCTISALPFEFNYKLSELAIHLGIDFIDLGGNDATLEQQMQLHNSALQNNTWIIPNSGLAPGLANILSMHLFKQFDSVDSIFIRGGGLPLDPKPPFYFQQTFSPVGLIKEYTNPATILKNGKITTIEPLNNYELVDIEIDGKPLQLESFTISGRISTLAKLLEGKVNTLEYKTIRYKGHQNLMCSLQNLGYLDDRLIDIRSGITFLKLTIRQLIKKLPKGDPDFVYMSINVKGIQNGKETEKKYEFTKLYYPHFNHSALIHTTAVSALTLAKFIAENKIDGSGGVFAPEAVVATDDYIEAVKQHGIDIKLSSID